MQQAFSALISIVSSVGIGLKLITLFFRKTDCSTQKLPGDLFPTPNLSIRSIAFRLSTIPGRDGLLFYPWISFTAPVHLPISFSQYRIILFSLIIPWVTRIFAHISVII